MAIKARALNRMNFLKDQVHFVIETGNKAVLSNVALAVNEARNFYLDALPQKKFPKYGKIYDDLLLALQNAISGNEKISRRSLSLSEELFQHILSKTKSEGDFKKEIFFLPYQASMWDSLESVWKAALEDKERCIAYVMPIPYADLNPDKSVARWNCDIGKFPKYVPLLDWTKINLKEAHPDVIFIHNAFDNTNLVTSVENRFYSNNLKECTDKLVYIPYSVEDEVQPGNEAVEEAIAHRVILPGVINADLVIVQSEDMRQAWINVLMRHTDISDRAYWEKKILGLGSPKIDKVLTDKKEYYELPQDWKNLIGDKKVILYNTSISATLINADKVCEKLRYVFDVFRNRDDVVFWWRPHPLMKSTIHSMIPQIEAEYLALEKQYVEEGWGIYDESPDVHRAVCYSDAYYGDASSVIELYRVTGKPVMIENIGVTHNDSHISCMNLLEFGDKIYAIGVNNTLFELDKNKNTINYLGMIGADIYFRIHMPIPNQMIFVPFYYGDIVSYTIGEKSFSTVLDLHGKASIPRMPSNHVFRYGDKLFFFGCGDIGSILILDVKTKEWRIDDQWIKKFEELYGVTTTQYYPYDACQISRFVWVTLREKNMVMKYDMDTNESEFYKINSSPNSFVTICYDGENFWLTGDAEEIVCWNPVSENIKIFKDFPNGFQRRTFKYAAWNGWQYYFNQSLKRGKYVYFSPQRANMLIAVDTTNGDIVHINNVSDETWCFPMKQLSNGSIFYQEKGYQWECVNEYEIDMNNHCKISQLTSNEKLKNKKISKQNSSIQECHCDMLPMLVESVKRDSSNEINECVEVAITRWKNFIRSIV